MGNRTEAIIEGKSKKIEALSDQIKEYGSFLVFEYLGLNSSEMTDLRTKIREANAKLIIHENNILNRTLDGLKLGNSDRMTGPNAVLLTKKDMKCFQHIIKLSKEKEFIKLKLAYFDNEVIERENLNVLSSLGSKEDLLIKLSQTLLSPLYKVAYLLKNIEK